MSRLIENNSLECRNRIWRCVKSN